MRADRQRGGAGPGVVPAWHTDPPWEDHTGRSGSGSTEGKGPGAWRLQDTCHLPSDRCYALLDLASSRVTWVQDGSQKSTKFWSPWGTLRGGLEVLYIVSKSLAQLRALGHRMATIHISDSPPQPAALGAWGQGWEWYPIRKKKLRVREGIPLGATSLPRASPNEIWGPSEARKRKGPRESFARSSSDPFTSWGLSLPVWKHV